MPTLTLQAMPGQFIHLVAWGESGREVLRLPLEPEPARRPRPDAAALPAAE